MKSWSQAQIGKKSAMSFVGIRVNAGYPYIVAEDGDYMKNAELYLINCIDLDILYLEKVFMYVHRLGCTVHNETMIKEKKTLFSCEGTKVHRKRLN